MQSLTDMRECRHGPKANCHRCLIPELVEALEILVYERDDLGADDPVWVLDPAFDVAHAAIARAKLIDPDCTQEARRS